MPKHNTKEGVPRLHANLAASVAMFGSLIGVDEKLIAPAIKNQALMRRFRVCFLALYEYLREKTAITKEYSDKPLEEVAEYFISKSAFDKEDKESFITFGSIYTAIRWSAPGNRPREDKIMEQVQPIHEFLKKMVAAGKIPEMVPSEQATPSAP